MKIEKLYEFPNKTFYDNKMKTKVKILPDENMSWPNKDFPHFVIIYKERKK